MAVEPLWFLASICCLLGKVSVFMTCQYSISSECYMAGEALRIPDMLCAEEAFCPDLLDSPVGA